MIFTSKIHGEIEYENDNIITFKKQIPGFDGSAKFILVDLKDYEPFKLLQSLEDDEIGLIVTSPFDFEQNYEVKLSEEIINRLGIKEEKDVIIVTTITLNSDPKKITTNLKAPIIINNYNKLGEQIILDNSKYEIKQPLVKE
ncbi:flagellar assembly protein FliW [Clostridium saccharobutylicum]|uniref:Flagellar assembly factor FliW n=1 Tax=Clostridium saccharobutylicum TaxID=169679 RepID=A0A1S8NIK5_CLOSA|nr:flagellar assembly protein FliW [Clostridium saccharobutylicum]OOM16277.1 flagellar assembly factor FliW [Clostridium saccharobutylicum]